MKKKIPPRPPYVPRKKQILILTEEEILSLAGRSGYSYYISPSIGGKYMVEYNPTMDGISFDPPPKIWWGPHTLYGFIKERR
jgi:hypothetical protein